MNILFFPAIIALTNLCGSVSVDTRGARVVSYVPVGGGEVFFSSQVETGGMSLCCPWIAEPGPGACPRLQGVTRYHDFKVVSGKSHEAWNSELILRLESVGTDPRSRK